MCRGRIVEIGNRADVFGNPQHAYTRGLLAAVPHPDPARRRTSPVPLTALSSPVHPVGHRPAPLVYREESAGHRVLVD